MLTQLLQAINHFFTRFVLDAEPDGGAAGAHLPEGEMCRQHPHLKINICIFHNLVLVIIVISGFKFQVIVIVNVIVRVNVRVIVIFFRLQIYNERVHGE